MAFPIIPAGMWTGQGSMSAPNANSVTSPVRMLSPTTANLGNAYDGSALTYADIQNQGATIDNTIGPSSQEVVYTHSPASGAIASSFVNIVFKVRATYSLVASKPPGTYIVMTASGNYSDATPISSSSNPLYVLSATAQSIYNNGGTLSGIIDDTFQITFDGLSISKTLDVNSLSISCKWLFSPEVINIPGGGSFDSTGPFSGTADLRIYDISYIYL